MPIYEYHCDACSADFEAMQKISDAPVARCEACNSKRVHKVISHSSFQLKGGGWYADLYGSSGGKSNNTPTKPAAKSEGKSEASKPAATTSTPASTTSSSAAK